MCQGAIRKNKGMLKQLTVKKQASQRVQKQRPKTKAPPKQKQDSSDLMFHRYLGVRNVQRLDNDRPSSVEKPIADHKLRRAGKPLDSGTRNFFGPLFSHDFSNVRIHTDTDATESAKALNAQAYTVENHIMFGAGQYSPDTRAGKRLLAHELAHIVQQDKASSSSNTIGQRQDVYEQAAETMAILATTIPEIVGAPLGSILKNVNGPFNSTPALQMQEAGSGTDTRVDDPNFLLCLILCYLGIPPAIWKSAVEIFLRAVWAEYQGTYDQEAAESNFRSYREEFRLYGAAKVIKLILTFAVQGKIGLIPIRTESARALQSRITEFLIARGATLAGLEVAEQIARKVAIAVEVAFVAGCAAYCGGVAYAHAIVDMTDAMVEGIAATVDIMNTFGQAVNAALTGIIVRPILIARATMDPYNWDLSPLPTRTRGDISVIGLYLWSVLDPEHVNNFVTNVNRPLSVYQIPQSLIDAVAQSLSETASARTSYNIQFTRDLILGLTPLAFIQLLLDWNLMGFHRSPESIADEALAAQPAP